VTTVLTGVSASQVLALMRDHGHCPDTATVYIVADGALRRASTEGMEELLAMAEPWAEKLGCRLVCVGPRGPSRGGADVPCRAWDGWGHAGRS
jgi:hypothetical protein